MILNSDQIAEIKARADATSDGPWIIKHRLLDHNRGFEVSISGCWARIFSCIGDDIARGEGKKGITDLNADFIAHARNDIPALIESHEWLQKFRKADWITITKLQKSLADIEAEFIFRGEKLSETRKVVKAFLKNWEEVEPHINGAFLMGHVHGNEYKGPVLDIGRLRKLV